VWARHLKMGRLLKFCVLLLKRFLASLEMTSHRTGFTGLLLPYLQAFSMLIWETQKGLNSIFKSSLF